MRLIRVIFINMKRHVKNPLMWAISFLLPIIVFGWFALRLQMYEWWWRYWNNMQ